jgi:hypothetical protein
LPGSSLEEKRVGPFFAQEAQLVRAQYRLPLEPETGATWVLVVTAQEPVFRQERSNLLRIRVCVAAVARFAVYRILLHTPPAVTRDTQPAAWAIFGHSIPVRVL